MSRLEVMRRHPAARRGPRLDAPLISASRGCGHSAEGTVQIDPSARRLGTDPVTKERRDAKKYTKPGLAPVEPGKLPPGRGRAVG